jgi:hypothetical protein
LSQSVTRGDEPNMNQHPLGKFLGLTRNELRIVLSMGGALVVVIMLFEAYVLYNANRAAPVDLPTTIPTIYSSPAIIGYQPAPSLTGWPTATSATTIPTTPTIPPTRTPRPTSTPPPTNTPRPTRTPTATTVPTQPSPTATMQVGTSSNPVPMGSGFMFPDLGTLTVTKSSWAPGQTGLTVVELSFLCGRATGERCNTSKLMFDVLGSSGLGYERYFDPEVPEPSFGYYLDPYLYGGETATGNAGFIIKNSESSLVMRVHVFLEEGEFFFRIGGG